MHGHKRRYIVIEADDPEAYHPPPPQQKSPGFSFAIGFLVVMAMFLIILLNMSRHMHH